MHDTDEILNFSLPEDQEKINSEERDIQRLEEDLERTFSNRRLTNNLLVTFLIVSANTGGIHFLMRLGLPAFGGTVIGGIVAVLSLGNALTKIEVRGFLPHFDKDFFMALGQTTCISSSVWFATKEPRHISRLSEEGKKAFVKEVNETYNAHLHPQTNPLFLSGGVALGLTLVLLLGLILGRR
ncbi:MAG: hypothetical protein F6K09_01245 [Merismopedia sp. SIO2A8]|nr:hypothetical protein [Symploca sp. SIO2B6]NET47354.1 hypothetical protein [Merismopedia sp. SIO2A8]